MMSEATLAAVHDVLSQVFDPCSVGVGTPLDIVEMGLLRSCSVDETGRLQVVVGTTTPMCMMIGVIVAAVEEALAKVPGLADFDVTIDVDSGWTPEYMSESARVRLDAHRADLLRAKPDLVPRRWEQVAVAGASAAKGH